MMQFWETTLEKKYYIVLDKNFPFFLAIFVRSMCGKKYPAEKKQTTISENTHKSSMCKL